MLNNSLSKDAASAAQLHHSAQNGAQTNGTAPFDIYDEAISLGLHWEMAQATIFALDKSVFPDSSRREIFETAQNVWSRPEPFSTEEVALGVASESANQLLKTRFLKPHNEATPGSRANAIARELKKSRPKLGTTKGGTRPEIDADEADATIYAPLCWKALKRANGEQPRLYRMGGAIMRLEIEDGAPSLRTIEEKHLIFELARAAVFTQTRTKGRGEAKETFTVCAHPPKNYARDMMADDNPPLPYLRRVVSAPVFASNGVLQTEPGYHPDSRTYYHAARGLSIPTVPETPTAAEIKTATDLILRSICDFPFVSEADRTNALAFALTPFARDFIEGPTPLGDIEATGPGTGKGLLADVLLMPSVGKSVGIMTQWSDEEECRKRITAIVKTGKAAVILDNVTKPVNSGTFAGALTALDWEDRMMGTHDIRTFPIRCVWLMTANNPVMSTEIARRCVRIRLDAKQERAWQRDKFAIPNLRGWMQKNRGKIIAAYLTLIRAWLHAGRPAGKAKLGSYEDWASVIGGILETAQQPGFLGNLQEFYDASDTEGAAWRALVKSWFEAHQVAEVTSGQLFGIAAAVENFPISGKTERGQKTSFGTAILQRRDSIIGGFQIVECGQDRNHARLWKLKHTENSPEPSANVS